MQQNDPFIIMCYTIQVMVKVELLWTTSYNVWWFSAVVLNLEIGPPAEGLRINTFSKVISTHLLSSIHPENCALTQSKTGSEDLLWHIYLDPLLRKKKKLPDA